MDSPIPFIKAITTESVEIALVFADWLEERGECRAAKLLRRRYKAMLRERRISEMLGENAQRQALASSGYCLWVNDYQARFRRYVLRKFVREAAGRITTKGAS